ncbi:MAG: AMP-binding enzyme, partial [Phocaeicola sp.]
VLVTNDIVSFNEAGDFYIKGRKDNTINSGGVKIQIEEVEEILLSSLKDDFVITALPDKEWGDKMVLLTTQKDTALVRDICKKILPSYWQPKEILFVEIIPKTETGKISRKESQHLALECAKKHLEKH